MSLDFVSDMSSSWTESKLGSTDSCKVNRKRSQPNHECVPTFDRRQLWYVPILYLTSKHKVYFYIYVMGILCIGGLRNTKQVFAFIWVIYGWHLRSRSVAWPPHTGLSFGLSIPTLPRHVWRKKGSSWKWRRMWIVWITRDTWMCLSIL